MLLAAMPAQARFGVGPRVGMELNSMNIDRTMFDPVNRTGFAGGVMLEYIVPVINLGFDFSVRYVHRLSTDKKASDDLLDALMNRSARSRDYVEIPLNIKYKLAIPAIKKIIAPFAVTGPGVSVLVSGKSLAETYRRRAFDVCWNFGLGIELFSHLQIAAVYGHGLNKVPYFSASPEPVYGKNNVWTLSAAWIFY